MARGKIKDGWCCVQCDLPVGGVLLPRYEYEIGCPLPRCRGFEVQEVR